MDFELIWWCAWGALAVLFALALPFIHNYIRNKEVARMFENREYTEYHDDMEDWE